MILMSAGAAGLLTALFLHWLTWTLRLKYLSLPVIAGVISALGLTWFFLLFLNSDIANLVLRAMVILYALLFAAGCFQARALTIPWWKSVAALFFEAALAFIVGAAVNLTLQRYIPWFGENFPGVDVYAVINSFLWTMILSLLALAILRPLLKISRPDRFP
jgi:hypothetical protein